MQYLLMIYGEEKRYAGMSTGDREKVHEAYMNFGKEHAGVIQGGNALQPTATAKTVRVRGGKAAVTDGPFAETKEQLAGYYLIDAQDEAQALAAAAKIPGASDGAVDVRPIMKVS
jgi:hypothetical protein